MIADFNVKRDGLHLDEAIFKRSARVRSQSPQVNKDLFAIEKAKEKKDHSVYNSQKRCSRLRPRRVRPCQGRRLRHIKKGLA